MQTIGAYDAKTHLSRILEQVEAGEAFTITKHERPVARLIPVQQRAATADLLAEIRSFRASQNVTIDVAAGRAEGRR